MAKQWSTIEFTETYTTGNTYDSTKNSIFGGLEVVNGVIRVPLPRAIPYLEQGNGALLANSVYSDSNGCQTESDRCDTCRGLFCAPIFNETGRRIRFVPEIIKRGLLDIFQKRIIGGKCLRCHGNSIGACTFFLK